MIQIPKVREEILKNRRNPPWLVPALLLALWSLESVVSIFVIGFSPF